MVKLYYINTIIYLCNIVLNLLLMIYTQNYTTLIIKGVK